MRSARGTTLAQVADHFAPTNAIARANLDASVPKMRIMGKHIRCDLDDHEIPIERAGRQVIGLLLGRQWRAVGYTDARIADDTVVRTRAAENRVFVVVASDGAQFAVDPDGAIVWRRVDWPDAIDLDIAQADVKQFNPSTDLWAQRRVRCYHL